MRGVAALAIAASLAVCGCAQSAYGVGEGDANYDALAKATKECKAKGGEVRLKTGYDGRDLSSYQCLMGDGR